MADPGWLAGILDGRAGWFPESFVEILPSEENAYKYALFTSIRIAKCILIFYTFKRLTQIGFNLLKPVNIYGQGLFRLPLQCFPFNDLSKGFAVTWV